MYSNRTMACPIYCNIKKRGELRFTKILLRGPNYGSRYAYANCGAVILSHQFRLADPSRPRIVRRQVALFAFSSCERRVRSKSPAAVREAARGSEGGLHLDSNIQEHFTSICYPHPTWRPDDASETLYQPPLAMNLGGFR